METDCVICMCMDVEWHKYKFKSTLENYNADDIFLSSRTYGIWYVIADEGRKRYFSSMLNNNITHILCASFIHSFHFIQNSFSIYSLDFKDFKRHHTKIFYIFLFYTHADYTDIFVYIFSSRIKNFLCILYIYVNRMKS